MTQNYRRNNDFNLWFTIAVSPHVDARSRQDDRDPRRRSRMRQRPSAADAQAVQEQQRRTATTRIRARDARRLRAAHAARRSSACACCSAICRCSRGRSTRMARTTGVAADELLAAAKSLLKRGQIRRFGAVVPARKPGFARQRDGRLGRAAGRASTNTARRSSQHRAVSHCYLRPVYDDWPYNLYTTVHGTLGRRMRVDHQRPRHRHRPVARSRRSIRRKEYKKARITFFAREADEWERAHATDQAVAAG